MNFVLKIVRGANAGAEIALPEDVAVSLGKSDDCDIVLGGYVGSRMGPYLDSFREMVRERNRFQEDSGYIKVCKHRYENAAIGAALYYIDHFIRTI